MKDIFNHPWILSFEQEYKKDKIRRYNIELENTKQNEQNKIEIKDDQINVRSTNSTVESKEKLNNLNLINNNKHFVLDNKNTKDYNCLEKKKEREKIFEINNQNILNNNKTESIIQNKTNKNCFLEMNNSKKEPIMVLNDRKNRDRFSSVINLPQMQSSTLNQNISKNESDSLFDKVLSQICKSKLKKTKQTEKDEYKTLKDNCNSNFSSFNLQMDRMSIEIKSESEKSSPEVKSKQNILNSCTPMFSNSKIEEDKIKKIYENLNSKIKLIPKINENEKNYLDNDDIDISISTNFNLLNNWKKDHLSNGESQLSKEDTECYDSNNFKIGLKKSTKNKNGLEYNAVFSTETFQTKNDISTYESYCNPKNKILSSVDMLERARINKNKITKIEEIIDSKKDGDKFWSKVADIFNPFKCDNK